MRRCYARLVRAEGRSISTWSRVAIAFALAASVASPPAAAQQQPQQQTAKPADIDRNGMLILIRSTLLALDHANKTGNAPSGGASPRTAPVPHALRDTHWGVRIDRYK